MPKKSKNWPAGIGLTLVGCLILWAIASNMPSWEVMYVDPTNCENPLNQYYKAEVVPVFRHPSDCDFGYGGGREIIADGVKVKTVSDIPDDPEKCVQVEINSGEFDGKMGWIKYDCLREER